MNVDAEELLGAWNFCHEGVGVEETSLKSLGNVDCGIDMAAEAIRL